MIEELAAWWKKHHHGAMEHRSGVLMPCFDAMILPMFTSKQFLVLEAHPLFIYPLYCFLAYCVHTKIKFGAESPHSSTTITGDPFSTLSLCSNMGAKIFYDTMYHWNSNTSSHGMVQIFIYTVYTPCWFRLFLGKSTPLGTGCRVPPRCAVRRASRTSGPF